MFWFSIEQWTLAQSVQLVARKYWLTKLMSMSIMYHLIFSRISKIIYGKNYTQMWNEKKYLIFSDFSNLDFKLVNTYCHQATKNMLSSQHLSFSCERHHYFTKYLNIVEHIKWWCTSKYATNAIKMRVYLIFFIRGNHCDFCVINNRSICLDRPVNENGEYYSQYVMEKILWDWTM